MVEVKKTGRTWGVFLNGRLEEGGFFSRDAARECAESLTLEINVRSREDGEDFGA